MTRPPIQLTDCVPSEAMEQLVRALSEACGRPVALVDGAGRVLAGQGMSIAEGTAPQAEAAIHHAGQVAGWLRVMKAAAAPIGAGAAGEVEAEVLASPGAGDSATSLLAAVAGLLSQVCEHAANLRTRTDEIMALAHLSTLLSGRRETRIVLDTVVRSVTELMGLKAAAIRLLDEEGQELRVAAVYNLSPEYLNKGPLLLARSDLDRRALAGEVIYVGDMRHDPRILYPEDARREGLGSLLCAGMVYRGKGVGVLRLYTEQPQEFAPSQINMLRGVAQLAAGFIRNSQLDAVREQQERIQRQVELAADVQRQLLPAAAPHVPPFEVFGRYEPCFELGGDFFDFIPFEGSLGVAVGDVVGKGVAAGLLMASVRASLRAHVEDLYDLDQIMSRVNAALTRDTRDHEFATVFYGTLDARSRRMTYCSAGHEPGLLLRHGKFKELDTGGLPLGIDASLPYEKGLVDLKPGDVLLLHTDGVTDASNFEGERFGRVRTRKAVMDMASGSARDIVNHVLWETRRFVGLNYRPDDMTIVAVKVH